MTLPLLRLAATLSATALVATAALACSPAEDDAAPATCASAARGAAPLADLEVNAEVDVTDGLVRAQVFDRPRPDKARLGGYVALERDDVLETWLGAAGARTPLASAVQAEPVCATGYEARLDPAALAAAANASERIAIRLAGEGSDLTRTFRLAPRYTLVGTPAVLPAGQEQRLELDRPVPSHTGVGVQETWSVLLQGPCLVRPDSFGQPEEPGDPTVLAAYGGAGGSAIPQGKELPFLVNADQIVAGSAGCDVTATFVVRLVEDPAPAGALPGSFASVSRATFQTRVTR